MNGFAMTITKSDDDARCAEFLESGERCAEYETWLELVCREDSEAAHAEFDKKPSLTKKGCLSRAANGRPVIRYPTATP